MLKTVPYVNCSFVRIIWWIESILNRDTLFEVTVTFDQFNALLLNKSINKKIGTIYDNLV